MKRSPVVYILTNKTNRVLYVGATSDLPHRVFQHRQEILDGFTAKYHVNKLVYFETHGSMESAISREKQLKAGSREAKLKLVEMDNPQFQDLSHLLN